MKVPKIAIGKTVFMWHLAGHNHANYSVAVASEYWRGHSWMHRTFRRLRDAIRYAIRLVREINSTQDHIEVIGSLVLSSISLDGIVHFFPNTPESRLHRWRHGGH